MKNKFNAYPQLRPLWLAVFSDILGFTIILPFLAILSQEYTSNTLVIGLLISSNAIFGFICGPIYGKLSDKYGRKPLLLISQAGTIAGFLILAFSNSLTMLFIARIVDGLFGGQFPISKAVISDIVPPKDRGKQFTNIGVAFTMAAVLGPGIGGLLADAFGIIGPGLAASSIAIFTLIFTATNLPESLPIKLDNPPDWMKEQMQMMNSYPEKTEINDINDNNKSKPIKVTSSVLKNPQTLYLLTIYTLMVLAASMFQTTFSIFGNLRLGLTSTEVGILFSSMGLFQVVFRTFFFEKIRVRFGDTKTSMIGLGNYIISYLLLSFVLDFYGMMVVLFYISSSGAMSRGIITGNTSKTVDYRNQGKIMGITTSIDNLSQIFGPIVGNALLIIPSLLVFGSFLSGLSLIAFLMGFRMFKFGFDEMGNEMKMKH